MRAGAVVVLHIGGQHLLQVMPVPDQQRVQTLGPDRAHPALRECVPLGAWGGIFTTSIRPRRTRRRRLRVPKTSSVLAMAALIIGMRSAAVPSPRARRGRGPR